eukprot:5340263-Pleurochrysis_carterae.AAC.2
MLRTASTWPTRSSSHLLRRVRAHEQIATSTRITKSRSCCWLHVSKFNLTSVRALPVSTKMGLRMI